MPDPVDDLARVVDRAVVGAELDHREPERARQAGALRRDVADRVANAGFVERRAVDAADEAPRVARGLEVDRPRARQHERAEVHRLVIVAVEQHEIVGASSALVTTLFDVDVPFSTKYVLSAL